jgi:hypothetical protein
MSRFAWLGAALLGCVVALLSSGCGADVDAGQVVTADVWFDQQGRAHCPYDAPPPDRWLAEDGTEIRPSDEDLENSIVEPYATACPNGHPVTWVGEDVPCWRCNGAVRCPECDGTGTDPITERACPNCMIEDATGRRRGSGACQECGGKGFLRYGTMRAGAVR